MHLFKSTRTPYLQYCSTLFQIRLNFLAGEQKSEEFSSLDSKCAFLWVQVHVKLPYLGKDLSQVLAMVSIFHSLSDHIIYMNLHNSSNLISKDFVHKSLRGGFGILQSKWDYFITVSCIFHYKGHFFLVHWMHINLVVARISVHEVEKFCLQGSIN